MTCWSFGVALIKVSVTFVIYTDLFLSSVFIHVFVLLLFISLSVYCMVFKFYLWFLIDVQLVSRA